MKKKAIQIILVISLLTLIAIWVQEMTSSSIVFFDRMDSFFLIYFPLIIIIFLILNFFKKYLRLRPRKLKYLLFTFSSISLLIIFLLFSFGQKSYVCYTGNCNNGYGEGLYISSERSGVDVETGDTSYNNGHVLGYAFFNRITWYDKNPVEEIYIGQYKNGRFHGKGELYRFIYSYDSNYKPIRIIGGFLYKGEFGNGWLYWDRPSREYYEFEQGYANDLLKKYNLDSLGFPKT